MRSIVVPSFLLPVTVIAAFTTPLWSAPQPKRMEGGVHRGPAGAREVSPQFRAVRRMQRTRRRLTLGALQSGEMSRAVTKAGLSPVGVSRDLPADALSQGEWSNTPDGRPVWRLTLSSEGAEGLRVHFEDFHAGKGNVWVFRPDTAPEAGEAGYTGDGPAGDGDFWSDLVEGSELVIAYQPGDAAAVSEVPFRLAALSHRFRTGALKSARNGVAAPKAEGEEPAAAAASCTLDVSCYSEYAEPASAVALMVFESGGASYECTGSLISSSAVPAVPYFLTANHCIGTPEEARSLISYFQYQTPACGAAAPSLRTVPRVTGATFLAGQALDGGDFTLLQLPAFPAVDVKVLGWSADDIGGSERVTGISHPAGDSKRISFGQRGRDVSVRFSDGQRMPADKGYQVLWYQGTTQGGSSGSPLLRNVGGQQYLVGTLTAGPDVDDDNSAQVCRASNMLGFYGRFSAAYPFLTTLLNATNSGPAPATVPSGPATFTASPNPASVTAGGPGATVTLTWSAPGASRVQIRVGSPAATALTGLESSTGSARTGPWVTNGMTFYLQDATNGDSAGGTRTLATVQVQVTAASSSSAARSGRVSLSPNPIYSNGRPGSATLTWSASGSGQVQIRVGSPAGTPLTGIVPASGTARTGAWITDGLTFYLQDASTGDSSGAAKTIAAVQARVR